MPAMIAYSAVHQEFGEAWRHRVMEPSRVCLKRILRRAIKRDPQARNYMDQALTPVTDGELDGLEMFNVTTSARAAADKAKRRLAPV